MSWEHDHSRIAQDLELKNCPRSGQAKIITWAQLGLHTKPVGVLNVVGYFEPLLALIQHASKEGFIPEVHLSLLLCEDNAGLLLDRFAHHSVPDTSSQWVEVPPKR